MSIEQLEPVMHADWPHPSTFAVAALMAWGASKNGDIRLQQAEISRQLRTSRMTVSREIGRLVALGVLDEMRSNRWRWNAEALADLESRLGRYEEIAGMPAAARKAERRYQEQQDADDRRRDDPTYLSDRERDMRPGDTLADTYMDTQPATLAINLIRAGVTLTGARLLGAVARHGEDSISVRPATMQWAVIPPHRKDDDCPELEAVLVTASERHGRDNVAIHMSVIPWTIAYRPPHIEDDDCIGPDDPDDLRFPDDEPEL